MSTYSLLAGTVGAAVLYASAVGMGSPHTSLTSLTSLSSPKQSLDSRVVPTATESWGTISPQKIYRPNFLAMDYDENRRRVTNPTGYVGMGPFTPLSESVKFTPTAEQYVGRG